MRALPLRRRRRLGTALAVLGATALVPLAATYTAPAAVAADPCTVPQLTDFLVSQGPAEYSALAAGKTSLVRGYIATQSCLPVGARVRVTGAHLKINGGSAPVVLAADLPLPTIAPSSTSPVPSTPSDLTFLVPGTSVQPLVGTTTMTFGLTVQYVVEANGTSVTDEVTFTTAPGGANPLSATVVSGLTDVDVLVVPLAVGGGQLAVQYDKDTRDAVALGFGTARRLFPTSDTGLRYTESAGISLPLPAPLCATDLVWLGELAPRLVAHRTTWNSVLGNRHMDRVLGEIDPEFSSGPSTGNGSCADGYGQLGSVPALKTALGSAGPGIAAYARAVTTTSVYGGLTVGSLIGLELAHTTGALTSAYPPNKTSGPVVNGQPTNRAVGAHSAYVSGDPRQTARAYNTDTQELLTASRSVMNFSGVGWHDDQTVLEKQDWDYLLCSLLPVPPGVDPRNIPSLSSLPQELTGCNDPGGFGYAAAAENGTYAVSGSTDGTPDGTEVHSTDSGNTTADRAVPNSPLRVVQRDDKGHILADDGIAVHMLSSAHHSGSTTVQAERGVFGASVPARSGTRTLEVYLGPPEPGNEPLYRRSVTERPTFSGVNAGPGAVTIAAEHPLPENLRLDLFSTCPGGATSPMVVGDVPKVITPDPDGDGKRTAVFVSTFDSSLACHGATLAYRVSDGIQSATGTGGPLAGLRTASAVMTSPRADEVVTSRENIGLAGRVTDALGAEVTRVEWQATDDVAGVLAQPRTLSTSPHGTAVPPAGGWRAGTRITLLGYDDDGDLVASTTHRVVIAQDTDADGISDQEERSIRCFGEAAVTDDRTPNVDHDFDGYVHGFDGDPCVTALTVAATFDPKSLQRSANGQWVTFALSPLPPRTELPMQAPVLYVRQVAGATVARLAGSPTALPATSYTLTSPTTATVKVDRKKLVALLGERSGYVPIVLGTLDDRVRGVDATSPNVFP